MIGRHISHFYIVGHLGSGGMGDVYEAQDLRLPRAVALKVLKPSLNQSPTATKRFRREAWVSASLNHPNICTVLDVGEADGVSFIAMEFLHGESLKARLRSGPLSPEELLNVALDVTRALVAAHAAGIVHRDLTPGNVFLTSQGPTKLLDFGLAKYLVPDADLLETDGITDAGAVAGTVHYMAPEQLDHARSDRRGDLFSLGAVLYHAATGARAFDGKTRSDVVAQIRNQTPVPLRHLAPQHSGELARIVDRLLEKDTARRYQRAPELLKDLEQVPGVAQGSSHAGTPSGALTLAVLPFTILGTQSESLAAFREGLAEDVSWLLQRIPSVRVAPRTSTECLRGHSIRRIGEVLGVEAVLEGTVQQAGSRLRIICSLIRAASEEPIRLGLRIDVDAADVLSAQDEAARQIAAMVRSAAGRAATRGSSRHPEAQVEYQRALHYGRDLFGGGWQRALEHAIRATEFDQEFAAAYVLVADIYTFLGLMTLMRPHWAFEKARTAAQRALALDSTLAGAHSAMAMVKFSCDWDWEGAEASFRQALSLDGELVRGRIYYSWLLGLLGRDPAAFAEADNAVASSRSRFALAGAALTYFNAGRNAEAIDRCEACLALDANYIFATYLRGQIHHMEAQYDTAHATLRRAAELGGRAPFYLGLLGRSYGEAGRRQEALAIMTELDTLATRQYVSPHCYIYIFHGLGERERALAYQDQAYADGASPMNYLGPFIKNLYSLDPHHRNRLRQMRLNV